MLSSSIPPKFPLSWAQNANSLYKRSIPTTSQIGIQNGAASLNDGFPPLTFTPEVAGGVPPFGQDFNGILSQISQIEQWQQAGGNWVYDSAFSTAINGYPAGAILESAILPGRLWVNSLDNNTQNPDVYPFTGWGALPGSNPPGAPVPLFTLSANFPYGYIPALGGFIGNTGSGGTTPPGVASPTAFFLFCALWTQFPQTVCPTQFNGANVARGANPSVDWLAGRVIQTPTMQGTGIIGQDSGSNRLLGVPVLVGGIGVPGSLIGENGHILSVGELAGHIHSNVFNDPGHNHPVINSIFGGTAAGGSAGGGNDTVQSHSSLGTAIELTGASITNNPQGSSLSHNNTQLSWTVNWSLAL